MKNEPNGRNPKPAPAARDASAPKRLAERRAARGTGNACADWGGVSPDRIVRAIGAVTHAGGAIQFGYTRDQGAYAVSVYIGGELLKDYIRPTEDVERYLEELSEDVGSLGRDG